MNEDRRRFLKNVGGMATALAASQSLAGTATAQEVLVGGGGQASSGQATRQCLLELDGFVCGWLWFVEGGSATASVLEDSGLAHAGAPGQGRGVAAVLHTLRPPRADSSAGR